MVAFMVFGVPRAGDDAGVVSGVPVTARTSNEALAHARANYPEFDPVGAWTEAELNHWAGQVAGATLSAPVASRYLVAFVDRDAGPTYRVVGADGVAEALIVAKGREPGLQLLGALPAPILQMLQLHLANHTQANRVRDQFSGHQ